MATVDEAVNIAFENHAAGRLDAAEAIYLRVLAVDPDHRSASRLLGRLLLDDGRATDARPHLEHAVRRLPGDAERWVDLARARHAIRDPIGAEAASRRAIALDPATSSGWTMAGVVARVRGVGPEGPTRLARALIVDPRREETLGRFLLLAREYGGERADAHDEATALLWFRRSVEAAPDDPIGRFRRACVLVRFHRLTEAEAEFRRAAALAPDDAEIWSRFGATAGFRRRVSIAEARRAALIRPEDPAARLHIGDARLAARQTDAARAALRVHLALDPASAKGWTAIHVLEPPGAEIAALSRALRLAPGDPEASTRVGLRLDLDGRRDEARALYEAALVRDPNCAEARWARSIQLLREGDWTRGWADYEWRFRAAIGPSLRRDFDGPAWTGERLSRGPLLLHAEQGFGDALQALRLVEAARDAAGVPVVLEVQTPLRSLVAEGLGVDGVTVVGRGADFPGGSDLPTWEAHASLMSLPHLLGLASPDDIPGRAPWLSIPPARREFWAERLGSSGGKARWGLVWGGNPEFLGDAKRSLQAESLSALFARIGGLSLVSMQLGPARARRPIDAPPMIDPMDEVRDFSDTGAILLNLQGLITTDTSVAHLAGALGVKTRLLISDAADFRWGVERNDVPWYPTIRLFRQSRPGDWNAVFQRLGDALEREESACPHS